MSPRTRQLELSLPGWGGRRAGAGRKASPEREGFVPHGRRPRHRASDPVHVTLRTVRGAPDLRQQVPFRAVRGCLQRHAATRGMRVVHFSVQRDHVHLLVEADDARALSRGMQGLASGITRAVNRAVGRRGGAWRDRYHAVPLTSPRQVRAGLVYVLMNFRKHRPADAFDDLLGLDPRSSARWLDGWESRAGPVLAELRRSVDADATPPVRLPKTWLAARGWKAHGPLRLTEGPAPAAPMRDRAAA